MDTQRILSFLDALAQSNSLDWMHAHKADYQAAAEAFTALVQELILRLSEYDPALQNLHAKDLLFRLNRDTRFSKDKSPYTPAFRAHISSAGKLPIPVGDFLCVTPGDIFLGGGLFAPQFTDATRMVRDYISVHGGELLAILNEPAFAASLTLLGEKLKNVPRGYDKDSPVAEYLKHKTWALEYHVERAAFLDAEGFLDLAVKQFRLMRPLNDYLNRALAGWKMPERP